MIYVRSHKIKEVEFVSLLDRTKDVCVANVKRDGLRKMGGVDFENLTFKAMRAAAKGSSFEDDVQQTGPQTFPDIIAKKFFGTEVKATTDDKWVSTGNSVLESTRVKGVERIYIFFGKFGGGFDVRYRLYQDCLCDVGVTHSPRYKIDMGLAPGQSIFDKMGVAYDALRHDPNPIKKLKDYYRAQLGEGEELWWIDPLTDAAASPIIRPFSSFNEQQKRQFMAEAMVLFPEMFGPSTLKFERLASYLVTEYNAVSSNLRDPFTAGGRAEVEVGGRKHVVPKIAYHLYRLAPDIVRTIMALDASKLAHYWRVSGVENDRLRQWLRLLDERAADQPIKPSAVFTAGLHAQAPQPSRQKLEITAHRRQN